MLSCSIHHRQRYRVRGYNLASFGFPVSYFRTRLPYPTFDFGGEGAEGHEKNKSLIRKEGCITLRSMRILHGYWVEEESADSEQRDEDVHGESEFETIQDQQERGAVQRREKGQLQKE